MKILKRIFICCLALFFVPMFFACNEKSFDDVAYTDSSVSKSEVVKKADDSITKLSNNEISVRIKTTNTFTFNKTTDEQFDKKVVKDSYDATIGKTQEGVFVATITKTRVVDNKKTYTTKTTYVDNEETNFCYEYVETFGTDSKNKVVSTGVEYSRKTYQANLIKFSYLFKQVMPIQSQGVFASVQEKSFDSTKYYKLFAGINGEDNSYETLNDSFASKADIFDDPQMFCVKDRGSNYVIPFVCEYGFSEINGDDTVVYSTISYSVQTQGNYENYLTVYSSSKVEDYGTKVKIEEMNDKDVYTANTFVNTMQNNLSYLSYDKEEKKINVLQLKKQYVNENVADGEETTVIDYFDYAVKLEASGTNHYYFKFNTTNQTYDCYRVTDLTNKKCVLDNSFSLDFLKFNFLVKYNSKKEISAQEETKYYYQFGDENSYINVTMREGEVYEVENKAGDVLQNINFGTNGHNMGFVENFDEYQIVVD